MGERFATRALVVRRAILGGRAPRHDPPRRILVAHNLLLGDTLMLTPLLAKLRARHPEAAITLLAQPAFVPLYEARPWGVEALPFTPADSRTAQALVDQEPFDLAFVVGDNRYSWLARAMGAGHVVAHAGGTGFAKDWCVDEQRAYPGHPAAWGDLVADLVDGPAPPPYRPWQWPAGTVTPFERPAARYAVLHVGASTPLKQWPASRWGELALDLEARGLEVAWSAGAKEQALVEAIDPQRRRASFAGRLDLPQLRALLEGADLLVAPDTGVAHLGRVAGIPTVTLYGPGSAVTGGPGRFWRDMPTREVTIPDFPCRDQQVLFRRRVEWVRRCGRTTAECASPRCMEAIEVGRVTAAISELLP
jgi:ADP-heptose:LPS heptosyltransferase